MDIGEKLGKKGWRIAESAILALLCSAYLYGGFVKGTNFAGAVAEMRHFGVEPAVAAALAAIVTELVAPLLVIIGFYRWVGALWLAGFTLAATVMANPFWAVPAAERLMQTNIFLEHVGLCAAFVLVAMRDRTPP